MYEIKIIVEGDAELVLGGTGPWQELGYTYYLQLDAPRDEPGTITLLRQSAYPVTEFRVGRDMLAGRSMIGTQSDSETYHRFGIAWNGKHFLCTEIGDDDKPLHLDRTKSPQEERMAAESYVRLHRLSSGRIGLKIYLFPSPSFYLEPETEYDVGRRKTVAKERQLANVAGGAIFFLGLVVGLAGFPLVGLIAVVFGLYYAVREPHS